MVYIDEIGGLEPYPDLDEWLQSRPVPMSFLGGRALRLVFDADGLRPEEFRQSIANLLGAQPSLLTECERYVIEYCVEMQDLFGLDDNERIQVTEPADIWEHVRFGEEIHASVRRDGDDEDGVYFSLDCGCDWEEEHGLQLIIRNGLRVTKVGPYDGHLTNSDAFADRSLRGVVYRSIAT
jgi:hypothetical protein